MIKRTLCFSNPTYLSLRNRQLMIRIDPHDDEPEKQTSIPIEDIGLVILDHRQITITHGALSALVDNNAAVVSCNERHMPNGLIMPLESNTVQSERFQEQIAASLPLRKQLWQQTVQQKIRNQAALLHELRGAEVGNMYKWASDVRSGDSTNLEGRAAAYYWGQLFNDIPHFTRERDGDLPNAMLNYGYAVLRAIVARSLVGSGLLPTLGIHHHNRYNAYCLADDVMEPYRPYVDRLVIQTLDKCIPHNAPPYEIEEVYSRGITTDIKSRLLTVPTLEVVIAGQRSPLMVAASTTTASLARCYGGEARRMVYPEI